MPRSALAWSRDGRELFYVELPRNRDGLRMMAASVSTTGGFKTGVPHPLFEGDYAATEPVRSYDVTSDGGFIMARRRPPPDEPITTLRVVLGWAERLKAQVAPR